MNSHDDGSIDVTFDTDTDEDAAPETLRSVVIFEIRSLMVDS